MIEHYWSLCYCWHIQIMPIDNVNTQTIIIVLFTSGSLLTWGKPIDALSSISPRYLSTTYSQLTVPFSFTDIPSWQIMPSSLKGWTGGGEMALLWGSLTICPPLQQFHIPSITPAELSSLTNLKAWGEKQKICHDITFLLILAKEEATRDRKCGILTIWVNPCQARVCSMEEAVKELIALVSSGPDWPYALMQLHKDTCHVTLPKEGYLGILPQGGAEMTAWGRISQLEVCQLLISSLQVTYPIGLNGHEEPIITSLPESLANGTSLTGDESVYLEIDIPQSLAEEPDQKALPIGKCSTIIITSPHKTTHSKSEGKVSMTMEVWSLLSWVMLDMPSHRSGNSTPRRPNLVVMLTLPPHKPKELPKLVDTSSQVSALDAVKMVEASLEGVPTTISPIAMTTRSRSITPPADAAELQENANKALEELLATKSSIDAHRQRAIWELAMELHWNESETAESIKEARAICSLLPWMLRPCASQLSRKQRLPASKLWKKPR